MAMTYGMGLAMLIMARDDPNLWTVELFKTLITVILVTGFVNMILAFYFAANKADEDKTANTAAAFSAIEATAKATGSPAHDAIQEGDTVTLEKKE